MRRKARKPAVRKSKPRKRAAPARGDQSLAARIVTAPRLAEPKQSSALVDAWLAALKAAGKNLKALLAEYPLVRRLIESLTENSPYLWELASDDAARLLRLLQSDPDSHLAALLAQTARKIDATKDDAEAMALLRRMKSEAALLIALADIGGVWPVMRATRALTELADTAVSAAVRFLRPDVHGYIVLAMG
ncbi:MAG TPA: bifunctional [glutamine synthetase] adenylyltransferase/[glutamine synthetase]-adenylyl-L-tyrosine phosphorylase, partial [Pseudolabrys sp.]|nr:bifunctional [glutamine synthetase] adenylyltransferase/[glutamine synthetase]-adenylyl-L-tyrosine phosphorylase [Pseudolabrys sp.]